MNQKIINIILAAGLAILLFLHFSAKSTTVTTASSATASEQHLKIAYVDLDSIQEKYTYYQDQMKEFEKKKEAADRDLNGAFQKIENERQAFIKRGQSITQAEAENFQRAYQGKLQNLEEQKRVLENNIAGEGAKTLEELKGRINEFLTEFNKSKGYSYIFSYSSGVNVLFYKDTTYNITNEVVSGLNAAYAKTKSGK